MKRLTAALMLVVIVAAGCGDDDKVIDTSSEATTPLPEPDNVEPSTTETVDDGSVVVQIRTRGEPSDPAGPEDEPRPNARIGLIAETDIDAWWTAITDDVDGARLQDPPGAQIRSTTDRLSASPAQWYDTDTDGEVTVEVKPGNYLLCAVTMLDPEKLAGCGEVGLTTSLEIKVLYADGQIFVQPDSR